MTSLDPKWHQMLIHAFPHLPDVDMQVSWTLWSQLSKHLISIFGETGFQSLYARSIYVIKPKYPWLAEAPLPLRDLRFSGLFECYKKRELSEATSANLALLFALADTLVLLVGESFTIGILRESLRATELDISDLKLSI